MYTIILFVLFISEYNQLSKLKRKGLRGRKASPAGMDSPEFKYFFAKISLSDANNAPLQLD
jgi:hypothetical protein